MNKPNYYGPFKYHIKNFIELKQALGYKYFTEAGHLKRFDRFAAESYRCAKALSKEIVIGWCSKKSYEKQENLCSRASIMRQFAIYLNNLDIKAYIIPKNYFKHGARYVPYIYTIAELRKIFAQTDKCCYNSQFPFRHLIMPVLFRMIYTCGLRVSEARLLRVRDVDLQKGVLTINQSKKDNSRLVPMTRQLTNRCQVYARQVHSFSDMERYFFPMLDESPISIGNAYKNFRKFLWKADISHQGRGFGPRIHDFRHTYSVHCLKKWSMEGKDLMTFLPVLRTYLGHDTFEETAYYLRLTADVFPQITLKLEQAYSKLIPIIEGGDYGAY